MTYRFLLIVPLIFLSIGLYAQNKFAVIANMGNALAVGEDLSDPMNIGLYASIGPRFNITGEKLYIKPTTGFKIFEKKSDIGMEYPRDSFVFLKGGIEVFTRFGEYRKTQWYPFIACFYNFVAYSQTNGFLNDDDTGGQNIARGGSFSYSFGFMIEFKKFHIKPEFEFLNPTLPINEEIINSQAYYMLDLESKSKFRFNSFNLTFGLYLKRR